jgi:hypothetical protein
VSRGRSAGDGAQRAELLGAVALLLPEVPAPDLPRVRGREYPPLLLGEGVLRIAAGEGQEPPRGGALTGLQVGADHLPVLADADGLRRGEVPGELAAKGLVTADLRGQQPGLS